MATLNIVLWSRVRADKTQTIAFRLTIARKSKFEMTSYHVLPDQFRSGLSDWVTKHPDAMLINRNLELRRQEIMRNLMDAEAGKLPLTFDAVLKGTADAGLTIGSILLRKAEYFEKRGSRRWYYRILSIRKEAITAWGQDMPLTKITKEQVEELGIYFSDTLKNNRNTIAGKMSILRRLIRAEMDAGRYSGMNAFTQVKFPRQPVQKGKLTWEEIILLEKHEFTGLNRTVRDMFLFSFYCQGMRFENCILFKKDQAREMLANLETSYRMNKGRKVRELAIHPKLAAMLTFYLEQGAAGPFLFPFVKKEPAGQWEWEQQKDRINSLVNNYLRFIAIACGIEKKMTVHIARHTFADLLKKHQAETGRTNIYLIQEAMGHSDIKTTQMYLDSLGNDEVNKEVGEMFRGR